MVFDVAVLGGGNAGLCAALKARQSGASVVVLESAPRHFRGGNSRHTRNLRCVHDAPTRLMTDEYTENEYFDDLLRVTQGQTNENLARLVIQQSASCVEWMGQFGVRFQSSLRGTLHLGRTNAFFLGGGKALMNSYYAAAERLGIKVFYDAQVVELDVRDGQFMSASAVVEGRTITFRADAVVLAAGGFESNIEWLKEVWGDAADNFLIRGTRYNQGKVLKAMLECGAQSVGAANQCHSVAIDARAPKFDGGIVTRLDCISLGIVVNNHAQRFYDEGEDFWSKRYAIWGLLVARQPDQIAYSIVDSKAIGAFMPSVFPPKTANSVGELAAILDLPADALQATIDDYNRAVRPGTFNHDVLDNCRTEGLEAEQEPLGPASRPAALLGVSAAPRYYVHLPGGQSRRARARDDDVGIGPPRTFSPRARSWPATCSARATSPASGMTIGTVFGRIAGRASRSNWLAR